MILQTLIILCGGLGPFAAAAPVPDQYVEWYSEPNVRGTWSILSSCVTTLVLCVYTAVHTNTPPAYASFGSRKWNLACWVLYGIFAPEFVVWAAWCQRSEAKLLTKEMLALQTELNTKNEPSSSHVGAHHEVELLPSHEPNLLQTTYDGNIEALQKLLDSWTLAHSFFVIMGGYQFHPDAVDAGFRSGKPRLVVQRLCLLNLLRNGHAANIPLLSAEELADRSKADSLAKILSCLQGAWLILQLLGRVIGRLTITELEVNTFAHVLCALSIYALWMSKPLNVQRPCFVASCGLEGWLSVHIARHNKSDTLFACKAVPKDTLVGTERPVTHVHAESEPAQECHHCLGNLALSEKRFIYGICLWSDVTMTAEEVASLLQQNNSNRYTIDFVYTATDNKSSHIYDSSTQVRCSDVNARSLSRLLQLWKLPERDYELDRANMTTAPTSSADMISSDAPNRAAKFLIMVTVSSIYGGLHASLWKHHFPTVAEMWMWRISSIVVAGYGVSSTLLFAFLLIFVLADDVDKVNPHFWGHDVFRFVGTIFRMGSRAFHHSKTWSLPLAFVGYIGVVLIFLCCRIFLFVDAFLTLRNQPISVYQTPQWSQWIPHL